MTGGVVLFLCASRDRCEMLPNTKFNDGDTNQHLSELYPSLKTNKTNSPFSNVRLKVWILTHCICSYCKGRERELRREKEREERGCNRVKESEKSLSDTCSNTTFEADLGIT